MSTLLFIENHPQLIHHERITYWDISSTDVCLAGSVPNDLFADFIEKLTICAHLKESEECNLQADKAD